MRCMKEDGDKLLYHDQDVLNFTLFKEKQFLPPKWNAQNGYLFRRRFQLFSRDGGAEEERCLQEAKQNPAIVHFTLSKPWERYSVNPYKKDFLKYKRLSPWRAIPPTQIKGRFSSVLKNDLKLLLKYQW